MLALVVVMALCLGCAAGTRAGTEDRPSSVTAFIVAHPDDWQLFMGDRVIQEIASKRRVVFLYATAGGADLPEDY
jgi:LmbE family N-acetylglucosaminyl deacetylase